MTIPLWVALVGFGAGFLIGCFVVGIGFFIFECKFTEWLMKKKGEF